MMGYSYTRDADTMPSGKKRILITGKDSYIGDCVKAYLENASDLYSVDCIGTIGLHPEPDIFNGYDVIFNVAGIAHIKETNENRFLYYEVNRDLAIEIAHAAKEAGAGQFILLSSMSVYGKVTGRIKKGDVPYPDSAYGESKLSADEAIEKLNSGNFKVAILRPPMVYGKDCKGNYKTLRSFAVKSPVFPDIGNQRSMIYIGNLCEFIKRVIDREESGLFFAQNVEYVNTAEMVRKVAEENGLRMHTANIFNPVIRCMPFRIARKVFGSLTYEQTDTVSKYSFEESIALSEGKKAEYKQRYRKKQALCIATVASNLDNFNRDNVDILLNMGYEVTLASNFHSKEDINSQKKTDAFAKEMRAKGVHIVQIDFSRSAGNIGMQLKSAWQVKKLLKRKFDIVHCHSPICAAIVRMEAGKYRKKYGMKVFYTAHGFHFYKGAPKRNWLLYFPAEWFLSWATDDLITITKEDYKRAKKYFHAKRIHYIPGVGVNIEKFARSDTDRDKVRARLGLCSSDIMLLSVGELNHNKNHKAVIEALEEIRKTDPDKFECLHYFIAGKGRLREKLERQARKLGVNSHLHLLGFCSDMSKLLMAADLFLLPSKREGICKSLMEAMAAGLPCIASDIRGNRDLMSEWKYGCLTDPEDRQKLADVILDQSGKIGGSASRIGCCSRIEKFSLKSVCCRMKRIYGTLSK